MSTPLAGIIDALRVGISPEADLFLGSLYDSSGALYLLFDGSRPEPDKLHWACAAACEPPPGFVPWAHIAYGQVLVMPWDALQLEDTRLLIDLTEFSPGSAAAPCPTLRLAARQQALAPDDLALRRLFEQGFPPPGDSASTGT